MTTWGTAPPVVAVPAGISPGGGGGGGYTPAVVPVQVDLQEGANDQDKINNARAAAVAAAIAAGNRMAIVAYSNRVYDLTTASGATLLTSGLGNAFFPSPIIDAATEDKVTIVNQGAGPVDAPAHWLQPTQQAVGTTIMTDQTPANDPTNGVPSMFGAPTTQNGYGQSTGKFNNVYEYFDGIALLVPLDPSVTGFDMRGNACASWGSAAVLANGSATQLNATARTHDFQAGIYTPQPLNNDDSNMGSVLVAGCYSGVCLSAHNVVTRVATLYCNAGLVANVDATDGHGMAVLYASVEECGQGLYAYGGGNTNEPRSPIFIGQMDCEGITSEHVYVENATALTGSIGINDQSGTPIAVGGPGVNDAAIVDLGRPIGAAAAPALPATTVALLNPYWRNAAVTISGGAVTSITVDGQVLGVTSGTVSVPSGKAIAIAYTAAPTWKWTLS